MKRICFVLPSLAGGGAERVAVQVLSALDGRRWDRSMYLFKREGPYLADLPDGVRLSSSTSESRLGRLLELRQYIRTTRRTKLSASSCAPSTVRPSGCID